MRVLDRARLMALVASAAIAAPALAQNLTKERANILAVDWNAMQVRMKDPQGRETTWVVSKDATVEFTDKREQFPNPKLKDLVPPMYVHFTYNADTKQIVAFNVAEVGFEPGGRPATKPADAPAGLQPAVVTAVDTKVGQVEVQLGSERRTFWAEPKTLLPYKAGDRVMIRVEQQGDRSVVTQIRRR